MSNKILTASFITKNFGRYNPLSLDSYLSIGGYQALKKALTMDGEDIAALIADVKVKGRGGAAYDMGKKWSQSRAVKKPKKSSSATPMKESPVPLRTGSSSGTIPSIL